MWVPPPQLSCCCFGTVIGGFFLPGGIAFFLYCICFPFSLAQRCQTHCFGSLSGSCRTTKKALVPWKSLVIIQILMFWFTYKIFFLSFFQLFGVCKSTKCNKNWKLAFRIKPPMPWSSQVYLQKTSQFILWVLSAYELRATSQDDSSSLGSAYVHHLVFPPAPCLGMALPCHVPSCGWPLS